MILAAEGDRNLFLKWMKDTMDELIVDAYFNPGESPRTDAVIQRVLADLDEEDRRAVLMRLTNARAISPSIAIGTDVERMQRAYRSFLVAVKAGVAESAKRYLGGSQAAEAPSPSNLQPTPTPPPRMTALKILFIVTGFAFLVGGALYFGHPQPEPMISGKPVHYWINRLSDLDPNTRYQAVGKLMYAERKHLEKYRSELEKASENDTHISSFFQEKFGPAPTSSARSTEAP